MLWLDQYLHKCTVRIGNLRGVGSLEYQNLKLKEGKKGKKKEEDWSVASYVELLLLHAFAIMADVFFSLGKAIPDHNITPPF